MSDGTADGTLMLKDINPSGDSEPVRVTVLCWHIHMLCTDVLSLRPLIPTSS